MYWHSEMPRREKRLVWLWMNLYYGSHETQKRRFKKNKALYLPFLSHINYFHFMTGKYLKLDTSSVKIVEEATTRSYLRICSHLLQAFFSKSWWWKERLGLSKQKFYLIGTWHMTVHWKQAVRMNDWHCPPPLFNNF